MRKWIVVALALALALAVVPLALAHPGGGGAKGKNKFNLVGTVVSVALPDATATPTPTPGMLTVKVKAGTKTVKSVLDSTRLLGLVVDPAARVRLVTDEGCVDGALTDLVSGMKVKVRGTIGGTREAPVFTAKWIKAKMMPTPEP